MASTAVKNIGEGATVDGELPFRSAVNLNVRVVE